MLYHMIAEPEDIDPNPQSAQPGSKDRRMWRLALLKVCKVEYGMYEGFVGVSLPNGVRSGARRMSRWF